MPRASLPSPVPPYISGLVGFPQSVVELLLISGFVHWKRYVVKQGPQHVVAEPVVVLIHKTVVQEHGNTGVFLG